MSSASLPHRPPAFTAWLSGIDDDHLRCLLIRRCECLQGSQPRSMRALGIELMSLASLAAAVRRLTAPELAVLESVISLGGEFDPVDAPDVVDRLLRAAAESDMTSQPDPGIFWRALRTLIMVGLVWGPDTTGWYAGADELSHTDTTTGLGLCAARRLSLHPMQPAAPLSGPVVTHPGISQTIPPAAMQVGTGGPGEPTVTAGYRLIAELPAQQRRIVRTLAAAGRTGTSSGAGPDAAPDHPVRQLIERGVLARLDGTRVLLVPGVAAAADSPDEAPAMRWARPTASPPAPAGHRQPPESPRPGTPSRPARSANLDQVAAANGLNHTVTVAETVRLLAAEPLVCTTKGQIAKRALTSLAAAHPGVGGEYEALVSISSGAAAGWLVTGFLRDPRSRAHSYAGCPDGGDNRPPASLHRQWAQLAAGWLYFTHPDPLAGAATTVTPWNTCDDAPGAPEDYPAAAAPWPGGEETVAGIRSDDALDIGTWPQLRQLVLAILAADTVTAHTADEIVDTIRWLRPVAGAQITRTMVQAVLDRAGTLGLADNGRPSSLARAWVTDGDDGLYRAAEALCPPPVEQVIIQNDRTIIAPGPLPARAAGLISAIATLEQPGVACVWRISETSIDHALAAGHAGEDLLDRLAELSAGPLPDTVTVAVTDALARAAAAGPAAAGPAHHAAERLTIHRPTTHRPVTRRFPDGEAILDPATAAGWVDALRLRQRRDGASHPADSTHSGMRSAFDLQITDTMDRAQSTGEEITGATLIVAELTRAVHKKQRVALEFVDRRGITSRAELVPEKVAAGAVTGTTADGTAVSYLLYRICSITRYTD